MLAPRLPELQVYVAGRPGRASSDLAAQVSRLGLDSVVHFLGARTDVADLIVASDLVVIPSRVEGMPGVALEAMALATSIVASDIPMVREAVGDCAAALVKVGDAQALAAALEETLAADTSSLTTAARQRFDALFSPGPVVAKLAEFYGSAIALSRWSRFGSP